MVEIKEIDISKQARALLLLRLTDYVLVIICSNLVLVMISQLFIDPNIRMSWDLIFPLLVTTAFSFCVYTGWRHVGVIDDQVWRAYMIAFPALLLVGFVYVAGALPTIFDIGWKSLENLQIINMLIIGPWFILSAILGLGAILLLRKMKIASLGIPLVEILSNLRKKRGLQALRATSIKRVNAPLGIIIGACGAIILLGVVFGPISDDPKTINSSMRVYQQLSLLGFFLLVRARRYFQVNADSLLTVDQRSPILFLRSFDDDEKQKYSTSERALLDFSLETRLSNHFNYFGPFIAIGTPKETVPLPGAARVLLSDAEWQPRVLNWMTNASLIIMYSGKTNWVNWELAKVIETERVTNLILMIPEIKGWRRAKRTKDIQARIEYIRGVFKNTEWSEELESFNRFEDLRAMLFCADGSMIMIKSRYRNRDSYHLAALIAHHLILDRVTESIQEHVSVKATPEVKNGITPGKPDENRSPEIEAAGTRDKPNPEKTPIHGKWKWIGVGVAMMLIVGFAANFISQYKRKGMELINPQDLSNKSIPDQGKRESARALGLEALQQGTHLSHAINKLPALEKVLQGARKLGEISSRYQEQIHSAESMVNSARNDQEKSLTAYRGKILELGRYTPEQISNALGIIQKGELTSREKIVSGLLANHVNLLLQNTKIDSTQIFSDFTVKFREFND